MIKPDYRNLSGPREALYRGLSLGRIEPEVHGIGLVLGFFCA